MFLLFLSGIVWLVYVFIGYAASLAVLGCWRRVRPAASSDHWPRVSVLIAARNEEKDVGWKINETLKWQYPSEQLEVLVGSDASDDATDEIVRNFAWRGVKLVRMERRGGKARVLNQLAEIATGELLFFTDANAHIEPDALRVMVRHFADPRIGCVTGDSRPIQEMGNSTLSRGASVYWSYETFLKRMESCLGSVLVCDGAIFCMRASLFERLSPDLANDLESPMRIGAAGYWVIHEPRALVFEHETTSALEEFNRRRRMCAQGMLAMFLLRNTMRGLRGWQFVSHKFLRWLSLIPLLVILATSSVLAKHAIPFRIVLALQGVFYLAAVSGFALTVAKRSVPRLASVPFYMLLGLLGALVGVVEAMVGRRFAVWEIPTYSRGGAAISLREVREK
jgi:cellulose synthase/poly-beta-1,6-N-acetylglucosamine synthase-like glycosyltransferase